MSKSVKLLTPAASNPKTAKGHDLPYEAVILHLAPSDRSGVINVCSHASDKCRDVCLNTAGHGGIGGPDNAVQRARIRKTVWFAEHQDEFMAQLVHELECLERRAAKKGLQPVARLNGTSDLPWHRIPCIRDGVAYPGVPQAFPGIIFYDYTKVPVFHGRPDNCHLTFSLSENNDRHAAAALRAGLNIAVVLRIDDHQPLPAFWGGYPVIDGTAHDFRFLDRRGANIVALRPKGKARTDGDGFVRDLNDGLDITRKLHTAAAA